MRARSYIESSIRALLKNKVRKTPDFGVRLHAGPSGQPVTRPEAVRDAEQAELAQQLRKLRQRRGLGDETRVATHAPMLLQLAQRCMDLEHGEQSPLLPRALQLVQDGLWACAPGSRELLEDGLNLVRIEDSTKEERLMDYVVRNSLAEVEPVLKREDKLYEVLAAFILEEVALSRARATHWAMANGSGDATAAALFIAEQFKHYFRVFAQMSGVGNVAGATRTTYSRSI